MTYEETVELAKNVKIKNEADILYKKFMSEATLKPESYSNGKFKVWSDCHNAEYIKINSAGNFVYIGDYLNNKYEIEITPSSIFSKLKSGCRGVGHIKHINFK
jgi:hypothetical protein